MNADTPNRPSTREERLAAKLRENLRPRKAQGRELAAQSGDAVQGDDALSKEGPAR